MVGPVADGGPDEPKPPPDPWEVMVKKEGLPEANETRHGEAALEVGGDVTLGPSRFEVLICARMNNRSESYGPLVMVSTLTLVSGNCTCSW